MLAYPDFQHGLHLGANDNDREDLQGWHMEEAEKATHSPMQKATQIRHLLIFAQEFRIS